MNILKSLNIKSIILKDNYFEAKMDITSFHDQGYGMVHGGLTIAFAETLAGYASNEIISHDLIAVGQAVTANHVSPKSINGYLKAYGELLHKGKKTHLWSIRIVDENKKLISLVNVTNSIITAGKDNNSNNLVPEEWK